MGLGVLGRGVGDVAFLAESGAELIVTDLKTKEQLASSVAQLADFPNITFHLGEHRLEDFCDRDFILKAAGVPLDSPFIAEAEKNGVPVYMSTALFVQFAQAMGVRIVGVTGTRGKSTTTHLIYEIVKAADLPVHLGGNVRGLSTLALLPELKSGDIAVLELDSWQLQGFGTLKISPQIAVFTNFMPDHLNYYGGSPPDFRAGMDTYYADKANIFKYQKPGDVLIKGEEVTLPPDWQLLIPGEHNRNNAAMAKKVAEVLGINPELIKKAITEFKGVPGRLELRREWRGVKIYNDTNSTTPDALAAALKALGTDKNIILIMGGADKTLDFSQVLPLIAERTKAVILLPGTGTAKLSLAGELVTSLKEAVDKSIALAQTGDTILFSPGFASFGLFANEYDRGDQFNSLVQDLP